MRIEDVTEVKLDKTSDIELLSLKGRFIQLWNKYFVFSKAAAVKELSRNEFLKNYKLLLNEMNTRNGMSKALQNSEEWLHKVLDRSTSDIDKATFRKAMTVHKFGVDVSDLEDIVLFENFITVPTGEVENIIEIVKQEQAEVVKTLSAEGIAENDEDYIPLYDLVLKAKLDTTIVEAVVDISKPYPNEHAARLHDPDKLDSESFRRTKGGILHGSKKVPSTISIIWGKLKDKAKPSDPPIAQSLRFAVKDWTAIKAKKWLADNEIEFTIFESAKKKSKKLLAKAVFEKFVPVYPVDKASEEHVVSGIVYEPDEEDSQGDFANEKEIRKAAYQFMEDVQTFKVMHKGNKVKVKVLESYIAPADFTIAKKDVKKGTWVLTVRVLDKKIWKAVKDGELTGFSMAGYAEAS